MPITHQFVSAKADGGDSSLVRPSNWNAAHTLPTHNETSSKQGGTTNEYYHLTSAQHAAVVAGGFTDDITLGGVSNTTSFIKVTHLSGADVDTFSLIEYAAGYATYPNNVTVKISETGVNRDRLMLKATDDMSGFMLSLRMAIEGASRPYVSFSHPSSSTDCPVMCFNMFAGQVNPCIQFADSNYVTPPMSAPPYTQVSGGSKGSRTYYLKYTYITATGETTPCALIGPISMDANKLLRLTIPPAPDDRITSAKIYIHTSSGTLYWQDTPTISAYSTTVWTESTGTLNTSGPTPPSTNSTGGVQFTMSSVYHGIGFWMKGVSGQGFDYMKIINVSDQPLFRITNAGDFYIRSDGFNVANLSGSYQFATGQNGVFVYSNLSASAGINLTGAGQNVIVTTQANSGIDLTSIGTGLINLKTSERISVYIDEVENGWFDQFGLNVSTITNISSGFLNLKASGAGKKIQLTVLGFNTMIVDETGVGINNVYPTTYLDINGDKIRLRVSHTPSSSSEAGAAGTMCSDSNYLYRWVGTNQIKRIAWSSF